MEERECVCSGKSLLFGSYEVFAPIRNDKFYTAELHSKTGKEASIEIDINNSYSEAGNIAERYIRNHLI